jgi:phenylacetate-CoA ligase
MVRGFLRKIYGNAVVLRNLPGQRRVPYLSRERVRRLRDERVRSIVEYASRTVPYYRDLFRTNNIDPREIRSAELLAHLPLLTKEAVLEDPSRFVSTSPLGEGSVPFLTTGTTGTPLEVRHDLRSLLLNIAYGERQNAVVRNVLDGRAPFREAAIYYPGNVNKRVWDIYSESTYVPFRRKRPLLSIFDPVEKLAGEINTLRPDVIKGYGTYLETFFRELSTRKIDVRLPRLVVYGADTMSGAGRRFMEEELGVKVLSTYQTVECFKIAFLCEERSGFHLHEDLCHVRIVDRSGNAVRDGEAGTVVISNLVNRGTVLLNYRLGDVASLSDGACPCGRTSRLLKGLEGRAEDILFMPDGRFVHPNGVWGSIKGMSEVLQYQLVQRGSERFDFFLRTADPESYERVIGEVIGRLKGVLGESVVIEASYTPEFEMPESGKFRPVVSLGKRRPG